MTEKFRRVQFDFAPESIAELEGLESALRLKTKAQVIRYAMQVLQWMVDQAKSGNSVLVEKNGRLQEVLFPFLSPVTPEPTAREQVEQKAKEDKDYEVQVTLVQDEPPTAPKAKKDSLSAAVEAGREGYRVAYTVEKRKRQQ